MAPQTTQPVLFNTNENNLLAILKLEISRRAPSKNIFLSYETCITAGPSYSTFSGTLSAILSPPDAPPKNKNPHKAGFVL
jgi:hypothetical protein